MRPLPRTTTNVRKRSRSSAHKELERITIRAVLPTLDKERCILYVMEHARVLTDAGVSSALPREYEWCTQHDCILIVAEHPTLGVVGGCRIQVARQEHKLAFERILSPLDPRTEGVLASLNDAGVAELCGLWVAKRYEGRGIPWLVTAAAVSVLHQINVASVLCLAAEYSMEYAVRNGFAVMEELGNGGAFTFPIASIRSFALINRFPVALENATLVERHRLLSLRLKPDQVRIERPKNELIEVDYQLSLKRSAVPAVPPGFLKAASLRRSA